MDTDIDLEAQQVALVRRAGASPPLSNHGPFGQR
jgi:hypothetical protein